MAIKPCLDVKHPRGGAGVVGGGGRVGAAGPQNRASTSYPAGARWFVAGADSWPAPVAVESGPCVFLVPAAAPLSGSVVHVVAGLPGESAADLVTGHRLCLIHHAERWLSGVLCDPRVAAGGWICSR